MNGKSKDIQNVCIFVGMNMNINKIKEYILPAEWYPQDAIQLTWPHEGTDWAPYLTEITETYLQLADAITRYDPLLVVATPEPDRIMILLENRLSSEQMKKVILFTTDSNDTWARDHGAISGINPLTGKVYLLDFHFNGWGEKFSWKKDNCITRNLFLGAQMRFGDEKVSRTKIWHNGHVPTAATIELSTNIIDENDFVLEGGSIESDGEGTIFTTSRCLMAPHRNQPFTQRQIEIQLKKRLGADRIIWLDYGILPGDDTDGHIDTTVRICPDHKILYIELTDKKNALYDDFQKLKEQLQDFAAHHTSLQSESQYKLIALPFPDAIYDGEERLPATYANFLILNGAVIVPTYHQEAKDKEAIDIIQSIFPTRKVIGIDARTIIRQHGSIHCLTMQYPMGTFRKKQ
jgi:agmatine/peptidylarginine deiminase